MRVPSGLALCVCVVCVFVSAREVSAQNWVELEPGLLLFEENQYEACGREWQRIGNSLVATGTADANVAAGLTFVFASRCFDVGGDARAYEMWGQGLRRLHDSDTDWEQQRANLARSVEVASALSSQSGDEFDGAPAVDLDAALLLRFESRLALTDYPGPRGGLGTSIGRGARIAEPVSDAVPVFIPSIYSDSENDSLDSGESAADASKIGRRGMVVWSDTLSEADSAVSESEAEEALALDAPGGLDRVPANATNSEWDDGYRSDEAVTNDPLDPAFPEGDQEASDLATP